MDLKQPDTVLNIYEDVPIANGQQLAFRSLESQAAYFNERRIRQVTAMTNIRHNRGEVKISGSPASVVNASYLSFNNQSFEGKTFYAAILDFEYVNNDTVRLFFEVDYWQTFMFDVKWRSSRIDREHLSEIGWNSAVANPYRNDIPELLTDEGMNVGRELEVTYRRGNPSQTDGAAVINEAGTPALDYWSKGEAPEEFATDVISTAGFPNLVQTFGRHYQSDIDDEPTNLVVFQVAEFDISEVTGLEEVFTNLIPGTRYNRRGGYRYNFSRGFFLGLIDSGLDGKNAYNGMNPVTDLMVKRALDWFAGNGLTSSILGIWSIPRALIETDIHYVGESSSLGVNTTYIPKVPLPTRDYDDIVGWDVTITNPKMRRAPFRYYRLIAPNGETHQLPRELFDDPSQPYVRTYGNFDDTPSMTVIPEQFNGYSIDFQHRLVFNDYPQAGYTTDGFLTYLSAQYQQSLANSTRGSAAYDGSVLGSVASTATSGFQAGRSALGGDMQGVTQAFIEPARQQDIFQEGRAARNLSAEEWGRVRSGDVASEPFDHQRDAFIADIYHAGNAAGSLGTRLEQDFFEIQLVTLQPQIAKLYDDYLTCYGYSSTRLGVPRVAEWVLGGSDAPHFVSHDGMRFTYVKTESAKVFGAFKPACDAIAALFDAGVRMINGEAS